MILTIGMIMKNEEKNLPLCLEGIKPILEAIPSELIIVDTGSTDNSVEIAKKYATNEDGSYINGVLGSVANTLSVNYFLTWCRKM